MTRKYNENYRLSIAYAFIFNNLSIQENIPIHDALEITSGKNLPKKNMIEGPYVVYGGGGKTNNKHLEFNIDYTTIGIGRVGARCGCIFEIESNSWVTDNALLVETYDKRFSLRYIRHYLSFSNLGQFANNSMQPVISKKRIAHVKIPLIDSETQRVISDVLDGIENNIEIKINGFETLVSKISIIDNWENLCNEIKKQKNLVTNLKQSILQEAIEGKLTQAWRAQNPNVEPAHKLLERIKAEKAELIKVKKIKKEKPLPLITKAEIPFELPEGWVWCRLGEICNNITSGSTPKKEHFRDVGIPYLKVYNIRNHVIDFEYRPQFISEKIHSTSLKRCILKPGDVIMNIVGPPMGKTAIIPDDFPEWNCNQAIAIFRPLEKSLNKFIYLYLMGGLYLKAINYKGMAGQDNITVTASKNIIIGLPPVAERKIIEQKLDSLRGQIKTLEEEIKTSETHAKMLMQAVLKEAFETS